MNINDIHIHACTRTISVHLIQIIFWHLVETMVSISGDQDVFLREEYQAAVGQADGQISQQMDGWMDGWMDGPTN